jgi:hypothetical protein
MPAQQCNTATELDCLGTDEAKHMGRFDIQLAHWREQHRIAVEDLKALQSGTRKMAEDFGEGWVDATDRWTERVRSEVVVFAQLVQVYEKLNTRGGSS